MNKRIRELAKQKAWHAGGGLISDLAVDVIAELIVRECMAVADKTQLVDRQLAVSFAIKEQFGVK